MYFNYFKCVFVSGLIIFQVGLLACATGQKKISSQSPADSKRKKPLSTFYSNMRPSEGSLWTDLGELYFVDKRARKVGDTIVVDIVENTSSNINANTKAERTSTMDMGATNFLGYSNRLAALPDTRKGSSWSHMTPSNMLALNYSSNTEGKGSSDRSGQITASIGASVVEVLPNSNLVIYGRREMKVNNETQFITVTGITRPQDIGPDNRVKSTYLADAKIVYTGKGVLADKQKSGWMARFLDTLWPF